ncbi:hypothetical protein RY831_03830 [Noviherbaspirillum sp. CPCC 100848]|uniref:Uncharacterized protein n=1 Tax=Noviherbaspirillum album TaxID=3080276 RepID=A0ABU6J3S3_9BURK|nr:hypothetical protein [Noviherbaspirillum sp. CPCC 100848]MEC4718264.1 hypothetical protein [Noviherbaspirillum sp. CPCC 100848]
MVASITSLFECAILPYIFTNMKSKITKSQKARLLAAFIRHSDEKKTIEDVDALFAEIGPLFANGNYLEAYLYDLNNEGILYFEQIGDEGFKPIVMAGCTGSTAQYLDKLLEEIDNEMIGLERRLAEILTFDPEKLKAEIRDAETQLQAARDAAQRQDLLRPLLPQIATIATHFQGVSAVAERYEDVYKNIIRPVQLEGESGVRATVRWAVISIVASTVLSFAVSNWKDVVALFQHFA